MEIVAAIGPVVLTAPVPPGKTPSGICILGNIALLAKVSVTYLLEEYAQ